ncbi:hypothetical protein RRG08_034981 [Elysia crispata]|uniref:Uncharacterized protein n=1 Tax=Elysia crispata TaxID=231223 RepID=A0AAE1CR88_9GAST|nr:hypothetical protein RRG08_034981 [Elysia crispata]
MVNLCLSDLYLRAPHVSYILSHVACYGKSALASDCKCNTMYGKSALASDCKCNTMYGKSALASDCKCNTMYGKSALASDCKCNTMYGKANAVPLLPRPSLSFLALADYKKEDYSIILAAIEGFKNEMWF